MLVMGILCLSCATHLCCFLLWVFWSCFCPFVPLPPLVWLMPAQSPCIGPIAL